MSVQEREQQVQPLVAQFFGLKEHHGSKGHVVGHFAKHFAKGFVPLTRFTHAQSTEEGLNGAISNLGTQPGSADFS